jgi:glycosyltransferase involved in cell wall biosynthesis
MLLAILLGGSSFFWVLQFGLRVWTSLTVARLKDQTPTTPHTWPALSVIIPARNEGDTIEAAVRSLMAQHYSHLQVVLVDDRSTDETAAVMAQLAAADPRIEIVSVDALPSGWLGKVHALQRGLERARGELLLFTDADTHYAPGALEHAVAVFQQEELVHLTLLPHLQTTGLGQAMMMASFFDGYLERRRGSRLLRLPPSGPLFGFGAFNLVRRSALEQTSGLPWLKLDVADDLALARLMREQGPAGCCVAHDSLSILYYPSLQECLRGFERTAFPLIARFSLWRALAYLAAMSWLFCSTTLLVFLCEPFLSAAVLLPAAVLCCANAVIGKLRLGRTLHGALLEPLALLFMAYVLARSTFLGLRHGAVFWRGSSYANEELRAEQRSYYP